MNQSIESLLVKSQMAITKINMNTNIAEAMSSMGYNEDALQKGKKLIENAKSIHNHFENDVFDMIDDINYSYRRNVKLSRVVFIESETAWNELELNGASAIAAPEWLSSAEKFYRKILNNQYYLDALRPFGLDEETIIENHKMVEEIIQKINQESKVFEQVQKRDTAIDELHEWISELEFTAKKALKRYPYELKFMGVY